MKKRISFSVEVDNSKIHEEAHKARLSKGKLKEVIEVEGSECHMKVKIKPKCSK